MPMQRQLQAIAFAFACTLLQTDAAADRGGRVKVGITCSWPFGCVLICEGISAKMGPNSSATVERHRDGRVTITIQSDGGLKKKLEGMSRPPPTHNATERNSESRDESQCEIRRLTKTTR